MRGPGLRVRVLGRTDDLLIVKGVKLYPAAVKNVVQELVPLASGAFRIVLDAPPPRVEPPLRLTVERGEAVDEAGGAELAAQLERVLHQRLTVRPEITVVPAGSLERTTHKEKLIERRYGPDVTVTFCRPFGRNDRIPEETRTDP